MISKPFQSRLTVTELINPSLSLKAGTVDTNPSPQPSPEDELFSINEEEEEPAFKYDGEPLKIPAGNLRDLVTFVNVATLDETLI